MNIEKLEKISKRTWCRRVLLVTQVGEHQVTLEKIMHDDKTAFQIFAEEDGTRTFQSEFENLKEAFAEYEFRT
mgnify:CR=1 FL=1